MKFIVATALQMIAMLLVFGALPGCARDDKQPDLSQATKALEQAALDRAEIRADPGRCPDGGDGYTYFALGPEVIHVLLTGTIHVTREIEPAASTWLPPEPEAPEGCFGHPLKVLTLPLATYQNILLGTDKTFGPTPLLRLHLFRRSATAPMQSDGEALLGSMKQRHPCKSVADGLVECGRGDGSATSTSLLTAAPESYTTPMGRPFVVMCGFGPGIYNDDCSVQYQLDQVTAVRYGIRRSTTPDRDIILIDRALRKGLSEIVVPAYPWRNANQ
jgi:hypothetical protein